MGFPHHIRPEEFQHDIEPERPHVRPPDRPEDMVFPNAMADAMAVFHKLAQINKLTQKVFSYIFAREGLPHSQGSCLKIIRQFEGLSQRELADILRIERATATVMLQKMERNGLIERRTDPLDQRVSRLYLTPLAREMDRRTDDACARFINECFEDTDEGKTILEKLEVIENRIINFSY